MKDTHKLDTLRNIIKNKASYISIMLIAFLGVAAFLSMDYAAFSLKSAGEYAYEKADFRDLELISPLMLTEEDIDAVRKTEGVDDTEPVFLTGALASEGNINRSVNVISLTERINKARVIKGRAPEEIFECAIEERLATELGLSLGDSISIFSSEGSHHEYLREEKYILTGIMVHPNHMNPSSAEAPYVFVTSDAFEKEKLGGRIMAVELTTDEREKVKEKLGTLAKESFLSRLESISEAEFEELISAGMIPKDLIPEGMPFSEIKTILKGIIESKDQLWVINDEKGNTDYVSMLIDIENISKLEMTFSLMFILVGAMIIYATIGKMIDEQREQIGGMKAFGMRQGEIFIKYLMFGVSATAGGMILGMLAARFVFEGYVLHSYSRYYSFDIEKPLITIFPTFIVFLIGILLSVLSSYLACHRLLKLSAVSLMQPKVPEIKAASTRRKSSVFSLYGRLILRNMLADKKRIAVTVAGVTGCCALIVTGFTIKSAVKGCVDKQYTEIVGFDEKIRFNTVKAGEEIEELLKDEKLSYLPVSESIISYRMGDDTFGKLVCGELDKLKGFYNIYDWKSGRELSLSGDGIYIQRRIAEIYNLSCGDEIMIMNSALQSGKVKISGIFENYIGSMVFMNTESYYDVFHSTSEPDVFLVRLGGKDKEKLLGALEKIEGFEKMEAADSERTVFESVTSVVNGVILMLVFLAALLAAVVLTNLTNMYMLQKKRELTIMRINGFSVGETVGYMVRETILTTLLGIVLGCGVGSACAYYIIRSLEQPYTRMIRSVSPSAWLVGAVITLIFAAIVNYVVLRKVKDLKLSNI